MLEICFGSTRINNTLEKKKRMGWPAHWPLEVVGVHGVISKTLTLLLYVSHFSLKTPVTYKYSTDLNDIWFS